MPDQLPSEQLFPAVQWSDAEGILLLYVRRPTEEERKEFSQEWQDLIFFGVHGQPEVRTEAFYEDLETFRRVIKRRSDGATPGYANQLWLITQEEWDAIAVEVRQLCKSAPTPALPEPLPDEVQTLLKRYGSSEKAWDAEDEGAWAILHKYGW